MGNALGIAAFVVLLLSVPIPLVGTYVTFLALLIATGAALSGEKVWTIVTVVVSFVKVFFLSPTWHLAMFGAAYMQATQNALQGARSGLSAYGDAGTNQVLSASNAGMNQSIQTAQASGTFNIIMTLAFLAAPIVALVIRSMRANPAAPSVSKPPVGGSMS